MVYRKNQRKKSLMVCIVFIMLFILGVTAGTISYAYFSDSAKAENTLNFGKLKIAMTGGTGSTSTQIELEPKNKNLAVTDKVTITGTVGLEDGSVPAYIRMKIKAVDVEKGAEIESTFTNAFLTAMKDISSGDMKWFVVGDYLYLGNKIVAGTPFTYNSNQIELTDPMIPERFQGINVNIIFTFEAIQSAGMKDKDKLVIETLSGYTEGNAEKISGISAWNKLFEPELNTIYSGKYATEYVRGDLDETAYKTGAQVASQMTKSPYNYFARSKDNSKGNYVAFGFFPQTIKANDVYIYETKTYEFGGSGSIYYKGSDGYLYEKVEENANGGNYSYSNGEVISQASANSYKYFKLEPIIWQVLKESNGSALLFSVSALTAKSFGNSAAYASSGIRTYLIGDFYDKAFTSSAKSKINKNANITTTGDGTSDVTTIGTISTDNAVFLLGYGDMINSEYGFNSSASTYDMARVRYPTDYAGVNHIYKSEVYRGCWWWLYSRCTDNNKARAVHVDCHFKDVTMDVHDTSGGCVPALYLNI